MLLSQRFLLISKHLLPGEHTSGKDRPPFEKPTAAFHQWYSTASPKTQYLILLVPSHPDKENQSRKPVRAFLMLVSTLHKLEIPCVYCAATAHNPECTHILTSHTHNSEGKAIFQTSVALRGACGSVVKHVPANAGDTGDVGSIPGVEKIPSRRKWQLTPVFLPGKPRKQRSLVGSSLWGHKERDPGVA